MVAVDLFYSSRGLQHIKKLEMACINCDCLALGKVLLNIMYQKNRYRFCVKENIMN